MHGFALRPGHGSAVACTKHTLQAQFHGLVYLCVCVCVLSRRRAMQKNVVLIGSIHIIIIIADVDSITTAPGKGMSHPHQIPEHSVGVCDRLADGWCVANIIATRIHR